MDNPQVRFDKIRRAVHLFDCFYRERAERKCREEEVTSEEITVAEVIHDWQREQYACLNRRYGSREYGWPGEACAKAAEIANPTDEQILEFMAVAEKRNHV